MTAVEKVKNGSGPGRGANRQQDNDGTGWFLRKDGVKPPHTNAQWSNENGDLHLTDLLGGSGGGGGLIERVAPVVVQSNLSLMVQDCSNWTPVQEFL